jgi:hypothetical protein
MKKAERKALIKEWAEDYAKSGECSDWLVVEMMIRSNGWPEARTVLDNQSIRDKLDKLCNIATSEEEKNRRQAFGDWVEDIIQQLREPIRSRYPNVNFYINIHWETNKLLRIEGPTFFLKISRKFGADSVEMTKSINVGGSDYISFNPPEQINNDFKGLSKEKMFDMISNYIETTVNLAKSYGKSIK